MLVLHMGFELISATEWLPTLHKGEWQRGRMQIVGTSRVRIPLPPTSRSDAGILFHRQIIKVIQCKTGRVLQMLLTSSRSQTQKPSSREAPSQKQDIFIVNRGASAPQPLPDSSTVEHHNRLSESRVCEDGSSNLPHGNKE